MDAYDAVVPSARRIVASLLIAVLIASCGSPSSPTPDRSHLPSTPAATATVSEPTTPTATIAASGFDPTAVSVTVEPVPAIPRNPLGIVDAGDRSGRPFVVG